MSDDQYRENKTCKPSDNPFKPISFTDHPNTTPKGGEHTYTTSFQPLRPGQMYSYGASDSKPWLSPASALSPLNKPAQFLRSYDPSHMQVNFAKLLRTDEVAEPAHDSSEDTLVFTPARAQKHSAQFYTQPYTPLLPSSSTTGLESPCSPDANMPSYLKKRVPLQAQPVRAQFDALLPTAEENRKEASLFTSFSTYQSVSATDGYRTTSPPIPSSDLRISPNTQLSSPASFAPLAPAKPALLASSVVENTAKAGPHRRRAARHAVEKSTEMAADIESSPLCSLERGIHSPSSAASQIFTSSTNDVPPHQPDQSVFPEWPQNMSIPFFQPAGAPYSNEPWKQESPLISAKTPDGIPYSHISNNDEPPFLVDEIAAFFRSEATDHQSTSYSNQPERTPYPYTPYSKSHYEPTASVPTASAHESRKPTSPSQPKSQQPTPQQINPKQTSLQQHQPGKNFSVRPPIRPWRLISLFAAMAMLIFCAIVGGRMIANLSQNEREMKSLRASETDGSGASFYQSSSRVELLPPGQTFRPTDSPVAIQTPSPTPIIAFNGNGGPNSRDNSNVQEISEVTPTPNPRTKLTSYPNNPLRNIMPSIASLNKEYPEAVGQVVINGVLNEVIAQRNNTFYLNHNYRGSTSKTGAVFIDESCTLKKPPENLLLRGQGSIEDKLFAPLWQFETGGQSFVAKTTVLSLTTLYEEADFVLFAVIVTDSNPQSQSYFSFASQPTFASDEHFISYVQSAQEHSMYRFNVDVIASDRLLTLSTLGNGTDSRCLVLIYRMLRPGESTY